MKENLSAFIDDELDERTSQQVLDRLHADGDLRNEFALQVMIGDVLRGDDGFDARFTASVMSRLDDEPTVLAPVAFRVQPEAKRLWMPAAAAVAGVALVSWLGLDFMSAPDVQPQLAVAPVVVPVQLAQTESPLRAYLVAHQGYSPTGSMQGVALYARGVSDPQTDDRR
ncbi:MAG: sigma-E factor negative regulatory protein [Methyloversatilis sp.]|nr:sigma-E factor negative regulatory protein [Methyloversatilis sp.]